MEQQGWYLSLYVEVVDSKETSEPYSPETWEQKIVPALLCYWSRLIQLRAVQILHQWECRFCPVCDTGWEGCQSLPKPCLIQSLPLQERVCSLPCSLSYHSVALGNTLSDCGSGGYCHEGFTPTKCCAQLAHPDFTRVWAAPRSASSAGRWVAVSQKAMCLCLLSICRLGYFCRFSCWKVWAILIGLWLI